MMSTRTVLIVDDEVVIREGIRRVLVENGYQTETSASGNLALERLQEKDFDLVITDLKMPGIGGMEVLKAIRILQPEVPVIIITGYATVETAVEAIKNGAFDYLAKPFTPEQISDIVHKAVTHRLALISSHSSGLDARSCDGFGIFVGQSPQMQRIFRRIQQVAPTDSTVLISGESGTGKELAAHAIHKASQRKGEPFVAVDCTSLAENLLESELFGHIKGSFTGATQTKPGLFKVADGGTLFLDEIGNISLTTQAKLLRTLQEREITPIGGTQPDAIDIRLIAATNKNLKEMVKDGRFREDLFFRLNIIPINLPPLRERREDLPPLIGHFLKNFSEEIGKDFRGLTAEALEFLSEYDFPGNVRELENIIERAVVLGQREFIHLEDLELRISAESEVRLAMHDSAPLNVEELKEKKRQIREQAVVPVEKAFVIGALERNNWNVTRAAEETGMLRPNFQALLKKLGISAKDHVVN